MTRCHSRLARFVAMVALLPVLTACLQLPESGPLVTTTQGGSGESDVGPYIEPAPPQPGESPADIVKHFFDAMMASSLQVSVAGQFLSREARASWDPKRATLTYADATQPQGSNTVQMAVSGVNRLDSAGAWLGPADVTALSFPMVVEDGEWRIGEAPDALIVPEAWFELRFRQVALYFFDPTAQVLVPEPVYVPRGEQLSSSLVRGLLAGPQTGDAQISRTFLPPGLQMELSVPVTQDGVAEITLQGDPGDLAREAVPMVLAQLAWTLRQDPDVRSFRLAIGDETVGLPQGATQLSVDYGADYDPSVVNASQDLYGLRDGLVVAVTGDQDPELQGPLSTTDFGLRDLAVGLTAQRVAGVTGSGREVLVADLTEATSVAQEVISQGEDILKPVWDFEDRLWLVDRRRSGAAVSVVVDDVRSTVEIPGVSGASVKSFAVSRDGSRFVAVVKQPDSDVVLVSRVVRDSEGNVLRATEATPIAQGSPDNLLRVTALGWRSPTVLTLVVRVTEDRDEIRFMSIDGGPNNFESLGETTRMLPERVRRLTSSPVATDGVLVTTDSGVQDPFDAGIAAAIPSTIEALTYVG